MYVDLLKSIGASTLRAEGNKLRKKDADDKGADDAGGRALEILATVVETTDFEHISEAKSLINIGKTLEAVGKQLQAEAVKAGH